MTLLNTLESGFKDKGPFSVIIETSIGDFKIPRAYLHSLEITSEEGGGYLKQLSGVLDLSFYFDSEETYITQNATGTDKCNFCGNMSFNKKGRCTECFEKTVVGE